MNARPYMAVESGAMAVCGGCAGEVARDSDGHLTCALPEQLPGATPDSPTTPRPLCPIPAILAELRGKDPRREGYRTELSVLATQSWLAQYARSGSEIPLSYTPPKKKSEGEN